VFVADFNGTSNPIKLKIFCSLTGHKIHCINKFISFYDTKTQCKWIGGTLINLYLLMIQKYNASGYWWDINAVMLKVSSVVNPLRLGAHCVHDIGKKNNGRSCVN
jgi:hypothetical protein